MKLFVYGTLKKGFRAHDLLQNQSAEFIKEATTTSKYQLYSIGWFPGLHENDHAEGPGVHGEVYELPSSAFISLDRYEGVASGLFRRGEVELDDGTKALAYFFNFNNDIHEYELVENGIWDK